MQKKNTVHVLFSTDKATETYEICDNLTIVFHIFQDIKWIELGIRNFNKTAGHLEVLDVSYLRLGIINEEMIHEIEQNLNITM